MMNKLFKYFKWLVIVTSAVIVLAAGFSFYNLAYGVSASPQSFGGTATSTTFSTGNLIIQGSNSYSSIATSTAASYLGLQPAGNYLTSVTANSPLSGNGTSGSPLIFTNPGYITASALTPYLSTTSAASTYYLQSNPSGYITNSALLPYLSTTSAASTYYLQSNPSGYITNSALTPYLTTTTAASTYYLQTNPANYITAAALVPYLSTTTAASTYQPIGTYLTGYNVVSANGLISVATTTNLATLTASTSPTFTNGYFTGTLNVTGVPTLSGVSNCNSTSFLQITSGLFGCSIPSGGASSTVVTTASGPYLTVAQSGSVATITLASVLSLANNSASGGINFTSATGTGIQAGLNSLALSQFTGVLSIANGGTATNTLASLTSGSSPNLTVTGGQNVLIGTSTSISLGTNVVTTLATGTTGSIFNGSIGSNTLTLNLPFASGSNTGQLQAADWTTFNNKVGNTYASSTFPSFGYASSTFVNYAYGTSTYATILNYPTYTYASSTYQPAGAYLTGVTADSPLSGAGTTASHLIFTNPGYILNSYASSTFSSFTYGTSTYVNYPYASSTFSTYAYGTSTYPILVANNSFTGANTFTGTSTLATTTLNGTLTVNSIANCNSTQFLQITSGLFGCGTPSGGGGATSSVQTSFDIPNGGFYNNGAGYEYGNWNFGSSFNGGSSTGGSQPGFTYYTFNNSGSATSTTQFRLPPNWDSTKPLDIVFSVYDSSGNSGNFKLDTALLCQASGTGINTTFNAISTTGSTAFGGYVNEKEASSTNLSTTGCSPTSLAQLRITRDNTISGNDGGSIAIIQVSVRLWETASVGASQWTTNGSNIYFSTGNVGIGTTTPGYKFVNNGTAQFAGIATASTGLSGYACFDASNQLVDDSALCITVSAARFKHTINPLTAGLGELMELQPVSFYYNSDAPGNSTSTNFSGLQYGLIADDVAKVDPRLVVTEDATTTYEGQTYPAGTVEGLQDTNTWVGLLVNSIQQQQKEIENIPGVKDAQDKWQDILIGLLIAYCAYNEITKKR